MLPIHVINLARDTQRRAAFEERNPHVLFQFFDGVDGHALKLADIEASGLFEPEMRHHYDARAYGCALSHWHLWQKAAVSSEPITIAEVDAVFRRDFTERAAGVLAALAPEWDVVLWGWNFDSVLDVRPLGTVSPVIMLFDQDQLRDSLDEFQRMNAPVVPFRLVKAFGTLAYTVSPRGAARMLELCFPQKDVAVHIPAYNKHLINVGLDVSTNLAYERMESFACFPPLAVSPNERGGAS
jgi:glycosyl transferase, family 25